MKLSDILSAFSDTGYHYGGVAEQKPPKAPIPSSGDYVIGCDVALPSTVTTDWKKEIGAVFLDSSGKEVGSTQNQPAPETPKKKHELLLITAEGFHKVVQHYGTPPPVYRVPLYKPYQVWFNGMSEENQGDTMSFYYSHTDENGFLVYQEK